MNWKELKSLEDWEAALEASKTEAIVLFKHSTRCSVSFVVKKGFERSFDLDITAYFLDLVKYRAISNQIASQLEVRHQSPQLILIKDGKALHNASHGAIDADVLEAYL